MKPIDHAHELEEVMAYLDGALDGASVARVRAHLASCAECRAAERDLRAVSDGLQGWSVDDPPRLLRGGRAASPSLRQRASDALVWLKTPRGLVTGGAAAMVVAIAVSLAPQARQPAEKRILPLSLEGSEQALAGARVDKDRPAFRDRAAAEGSYAAPQASVTGGGPLIVRTARLSIVANDFDRARQTMERLVADAGGFIGQMLTHGTAATARRLEATLRVPTARMDDVVTSLRALGQVVSEARDGEDVTQESADLDTRLANARVSEKRLRDILAERTGKLADVLEVEREIARVRGEIEQMESHRRTLDRRVTYATIVISLSEDRKAEVNLGPVPVPRQIQNAFVEGCQQAMESVIGLALFVVRVAPTLLLWGVFLGVPAWLMRRRIVARP